jgi:predicted amidohydrolase
MTAPMTVAPYTLALCRPPTQNVFGADGVVAGALAANVALYADLIAKAADEHGAKLVVFPQFSLSHYTPLGQDIWLEAAITFPGPEADAIGAACQKSGAYAVVQTAEKHPAFPDLYFLSSAIFTPSGEVGLIYRKTYAMSLRTSPGDVLSRFVDVFGQDALFPVLHTELGTLATLIGAEVHWPEPVRELALKGAEVICNPVAAVQSLDYLNRAGADLVRPVRAFENAAYLAMANYADGTVDSAAYDFNGASIGQKQDGDFTLATIDIAALRAARANPSAHLLAQIQPDLHKGLYTQSLWPAENFAGGPPRSFDALLATEREVAQAMERRWGR